MANPVRHESAFTVDGRIYVLKWDFGAMAEIEAALDLRGPRSLYERLNDLGFSDVIAILEIMSRRGGEEISAESLRAMPFDAFIPACEAIAKAINGPGDADGFEEKKMKAAGTAHGAGAA